MADYQSYSLIPGEIDEWLASHKLVKAKEVAATDRAIRLSLELAEVKKQLVTIVSDETFPRTSLFDQLTMDRLQSRATAAEQKLQQATAEGEELRKDKERLDWLESLYANVRVSLVDGSRENLAYVWAAPRMRELIDAARSPKESTP